MTTGFYSTRVLEEEVLYETPSTKDRISERWVELLLKTHLDRIRMELARQHPDSKIVGVGEVEIIYKRPPFRDVVRIPVTVAMYYL